ncbi:hypothetical protein V8D89_007979 [Ganoderma adspersum]
MASPVHCVTASSSRTDQSRILRPFAPLLSGQARHLPHAFTTLIRTMSPFAIYHAHLLQFPSRNHLGGLAISNAAKNTPRAALEDVGCCQGRHSDVRVHVRVRPRSLLPSATSPSRHRDGWLCRAKPFRLALASPSSRATVQWDQAASSPQRNSRRPGVDSTESAGGRPAALAGVSVLVFGTIGVVPGPRCPAKFYVLCPPHPPREPHRVVGRKQGVRRMGGCAAELPDCGPPGRIRAVATQSIAGLLRRSFCRACVQPTCSMTMGADTDTDQEQVQASPYASTTIDGGDGPECHIYGATQPATGQYDESRGHEDLGLGICGDRSEGP